MPVQYNIVKRSNQINRNEPDKYYLSLLQKDTTDLNELVDMISRYSTVNPPDVLAVLESLIRLVPEELAQGRGVQLGRLGSFKITVSSEGQLRKKDVSPKNVKKINMHFRPGKSVKNELENLKFERIKESKK